ncbi:MAG: TolC family protein [Fibrobacter sp.]|nr:TolC family protein [Fibrobacter sp.]
MKSKYYRILQFSLSLLCISFTMLYAQQEQQTYELSAQKAVEMALSNNRSIKALDHQLKGAQYDVKSAATNFFPQASLSAQYTRLSEIELSGAMANYGSLMGAGLENSYSVGLQVSQPIFTGFQLVNGLKSAKTAKVLQETTNQKTKQAIEYGVMQIYWGLVSLQKSQVVANEAKKQLEELASNQAAMMEQGVTTEHDYLLTKAALAQAEVGVLNVEETLKSMKRQFSVLLGLPVNSEIVLTDTNAGAKEIAAVNIDSLISNAKSERLDLKETCLQLQLSELSVKSLKSAWFPSLYANFAYNYANPDQLRQEEWGDNWTLTAALNFTLWDWGNRSYKIKKAKEQKLSLTELFAQKQETIESEVLDAYKEVNMNIKNLEVANLTAEAHEKNYQASVAKHEEGVISTYELLDTHNDYISAQYQALQAATNLELAVVNLRMGGLGKAAASNQ